MSSTIKIKTSEKEALTTAIGGYLGYEKPDQRDDTDKNFRQFLTSQLNSISERLVAVEKQFLKNGKGKRRDVIQHVKTSLQTIIDSLQNPCYCNHEFFARKNIGQRNLVRLYDYDSQLMEHVEILAEESNQFTEKVDEFEANEILKHLYDLIDGLNQSLTEREFVIMGESQ